MLENEDVTRLRGRRRLRAFRSQVQMIFQDPFASLNPVKRVDHHIARPLRIHRIVTDDQVTARVHELLESVGLVPADGVSPRSTRTSCRAVSGNASRSRGRLAVEPKVVLADEPISMLDVSIRLGILNLVRELKEREQLAFLYITHDLASARYVADEIHVMYTRPHRRARPDRRRPARSPARVHQAPAHRRAAPRGRAARRGVGGAHRGDGGARSPWLGSRRPHEARRGAAAATSSTSAEING